MLLYFLIGAAAIAVGYSVVRFQADGEVRFGAFVVGIFLVGMGTTQLLEKLNEHDGLPAKLGDETRQVRVTWMDKEQICFFLLDEREEGCALRSDLIGLDWALKNTPFVGPTFEVRRAEYNGIFQGVEIINPHDQNQQVQQ